MKQFYLIAILLMTLSLESFSQNAVNQLVIGNGGVFGNPNDHVTITGFNPVTQTMADIGEVFRESIQDLIVVDSFAYVCAEDSIVKFNIHNSQKIAAVYESNLSRLYFHEGLLYVSRRSDINGPPSDGLYLKVFQATDLTSFADVSGISSDAAGIAITGDSVYVAVPGDWTASEGKIATFGLDLAFGQEINLGPEAAGSYDLFLKENWLFIVNKSPYGYTTGSVTKFDIYTGIWQTYSVEMIVGKGIDLVDGNLYLGLDYGVGRFDIASSTFNDQLIIPDPGSSSFIYFGAVTFDRVNELFYCTVTDYFSTGYGKIYNLSGAGTGSFDAGISAEAIAIDYLTQTSVNANERIPVIKLFPNPASSFAQVRSASRIKCISVYNQNGARIEANHAFIEQHANLKVDKYPPGIYLVEVLTENGRSTQKLLKR